MIRTFRSDDAPAVVGIWEACGLLRPWNDPHRDIERKLLQNDDLFLVSESEGDVIGTVMAGYDGHRGWIYYLAVHPRHRHAGVGRELMEEAEARLRSRGCPKVNLQVRTDNAGALRFYEQLGYAPDEVISLGKRHQA
ncbi:MAG: GNAT family acetyltransferase [Actinomycetota bacterium]